MNPGPNKNRPPLPTGTVTFLFTDIEGSSALAHDHPDEINLLLERHNEILRQSIEAHNGVVFRIIGDAFNSAFHTSGDAIGAALEAQRRLQNEVWHPTPVKVRMGIHTGAAQAGKRDDLGDDYSGYLTLTRVQRVMSVAHGGQTLLSSTSAELARGQLPKDVTLRDLGEHRLKGLVNPERLWQLVAPDLVAEFPPLRSFNAIPNNLPAQPTALIGREVELSEIVKRLSSAQARLLTLSGPGGIGKTRISLQAAAELIDQFEDGVYFIDLAPIREPAAVPIAIGQTLGLRESSDRPPLAELKEQLRAKKMLLLLDNFEQVTGAAPMVAELIRDCPQLKLLVTSREALRLRGEYVFPLSPLGLPDTDLKKLSLEQLTRYEALRLFIERAQAVRPDFQATEENARVVAEICARLDGLPLAIELAAARIRLFSPQALLERLGSRLNLLRGGARDLPARQQALRAAIDWSYEMLDPGEQRLFEMLATFQGCTFEAAEEVASQVEQLVETGVDIFDGLASLADKSLIRQLDQKTGGSRFGMLETIREYAVERLEGDPAFQAAVHRAHAAHFAEFTQRQWLRLTGDEREAALEELSADLENARIAWRYWVRKKDLERLGKLVDSLWLLFDVRGWYHAAVDLATDLLDVLSSVPSTPEHAQQEVVLRTSLARALLATKGYTPEVEEAYTRALELSLAAEDVSQMFPVLRGLFSFYTLQGNFEKALPIGEQILTLAERYDDGNMRVEGHLVLGACHAFTGNVSLGLEHLEKGISFIDPYQRRSSRFRLGNYPGVSCYTTAALILWGIGYPDRALQRANEALDLVNKLNHPYSLAYTLFHAGFLRYWRREAEISLGCAQDLLDVAEQHKFQIWYAVGTCLHGAGIASLGKAQEGLAQIQLGMDIYQGLKSPPIFWPLLRSMQAGVCGLAGKPEQGLALLDEVLAIPSQGYGRVLMADFYRLKGDLLLAHSPDQPAEAGLWYQLALETAREQSATTLELRSAIGLARLHRDQESRQILSETYAKFSEGFTTPDLMEARDLLKSS